MMAEPEISLVVASDVNSRDGIGVELYVGDELIVEVFRDDTARTREVCLYDEKVSLDLVERCIESFKNNDLWEFIDYDIRD